MLPQLYQWHKTQIRFTADIVSNATYEEGKWDELPTAWPKVLAKHKKNKVNSLRETDANSEMHQVSVINKLNFTCC